MMEPPGTSCPPNAFTPSRCAFESRPFLELPKPFLCAMRNFRYASLLKRCCLSDDVADPNLRIILPMALGALVLLFALELKNQTLAAAVLIGNGGVHRRRAEVAA